MEPDSIIGVILHFQMVEKKERKKYPSRAIYGQTWCKSKEWEQKKLTASPHLHWCFLGMPALT